ncbi:MAG: 4-(cytidine 5'-diphospho)-2-C-methyl-D-erythritol kinase [Nitrospirae bacterium YQR-1]
MLILTAPAKINWFLYVTGLRADGYHDIASLFQAVSVCDTLEFKKTDDATVFSPLTLESDLKIPADANLVSKALKVLAGYIKSSCATAENNDGKIYIRLKKEIPSEAGLGGGSSDAATALMGMNMLFNLNLSTGTLVKLASEVGSDVPFFIRGTTAMVEGRGELVTPVELDSTVPLLLLKPPVSISTPWAYGRVDDMTDKKIMRHNKALNIPAIVNEFIKAMKTGDFQSVASLMRNDIEEAIRGDFPWIDEIKGLLRSKGALVSLLSGSGSAIFGAFDNDRKRNAALECFEKRYPDFWIKPAVTLKSSLFSINDGP